jgi:hypothetical protein
MRILTQRRRLRCRFADAACGTVARMDDQRLATTFIVRITEGDERPFRGTVERARTGERRRFLGIAHLAEVIAAMAGAPADASFHPRRPT